MCWGGHMALTLEVKGPFPGLGVVLSPKTSAHSLTPRACDLTKNRVFAGGTKLRGGHGG